MNVSKSVLLFVFIILIIPSDAQERRCPIAKPADIACDYDIKKGKFSIKNIVTDFGADPTGKSNSHNAFECAAYYFNQTGGNGKLIIPFGKYIVGKQTFIGKNEALFKQTGGVGWAAKYVFYLTECKNLSIEGIRDRMSGKAPMIRFEDGMKLGGITSKGTPSEIKDKQNNRYTLPTDFQESAATETYRSTPASLFSFEDCKNMTISNIVLDGNCRNYVLGSYFGPGTQPYELWCHGIQIYNTTNFKILKTDITDFGCDGIMIKNAAADSVANKNDKLVIEGCNISYCGRNNISWVGGYGLIVKNTTLSYAGMGRSKTDPGSGIDIEPESHELRNSRCEYLYKDGKKIMVNDYCINGVIINCTIKGNRISGITNASENGKTLNCRVVGTTITSDSAWSLTLINKNYIDFIGCKISGSWAIDKKINQSLKGDPRFKNCTVKLNVAKK